MRIKQDKKQKLFQIKQSLIKKNNEQNMFKELDLIINKITKENYKELKRCRNENK